MLVITVIYCCVTNFSPKLPDISCSFWGSGIQELLKWVILTQSLWLRFELRLQSSAGAWGTASEHLLAYSEGIESQSCSFSSSSCEPLLSAAHMTWQLAFSRARPKKRKRKRQSGKETYRERLRWERDYDYNITLAVTSYHFYHILFIRSKSLNLALLKGRRIKLHLFKGKAS